MTITPTGFTPFNGLIGPLNRATPFTHRDNATFLRILQDLIEYVNTTFNGQVNAEMQRILDEFQAILTGQQTDFDAVKADWDSKFALNNDALEAQIALLNTDAVNGMITAPAGVVRATIQGLIDAAKTALQTEIDATISEVADLEANNGYMVATFLADGVDGEKLSLFYSPDGKTIAGSAGINAYVPGDGQGVRDPSLIRHAGKWFVAYTSNNGADKDFMIASSPSGAPGTWTQIVTVSCADLPDVSRIWAPELVVAPDGVHVFFSKVRASNTATGMMYWIKATNDSLTGWTVPAPLQWTAEPAHYIDGVPALGDDGKWYLFYSTGNDIERATATSLTGVWTRDKSGNWAGWGTGIEGPYLTREGSTWRMYFDRYTAGTGVAWSESPDLTNWTVPVNITVAAGSLGDGQRIRHGSFYKLGEPVADRQALALQLGRVTSRVRHMELTSAPGVTGGAGATVTVTGWATDTNETTDAGIVSYDPATGYLTFNEFGVYAISGNCGAIGVTGVNRSFMEMRSVDGPDTNHQRTPGGAEDAFGLSIPNFKTNHAGERVKINTFSNWTGGQAQATYPVRLRITKLA